MKENIKYGVLIVALLLIIVLLVIGIVKDDKDSSVPTSNISSDNVTNDNISNDNTSKDEKVPIDDNENYIGSNKALSIALEKLNIKESDIHDIDVELDYKYSKDVYEVNFNYNKEEYEFYIDAESGKIIHSFKERD